MSGIFCLVYFVRYILSGIYIYCLICFVPVPFVRYILSGMFCPDMFCLVYFARVYFFQVYFVRVYFVQVYFILAPQDIVFRRNGRDPIKIDGYDELTVDINYIELCSGGKLAENLHL